MIIEHAWRQFVEAHKSELQVLWINKVVREAFDFAWEASRDDTIDNLIEMRLNQLREELNEARYSR